MRPTEQDLFAEEQAMPSMSFGEHIEELRVRLILGLMGLAVGVVITFIPPLDLGRRIMSRMQAPAQASLDRYYTEQAKKRSEEAKAKATVTPVFEVEVPARAWWEAVKKVDPRIELPAGSGAALEDQWLTLPMRYKLSDTINLVNEAVEKKSALIALAPLETFMIYFMVCIVAGLVLSSPWVFYQLWAFVAAGLYRHERRVVMRFLPFAVGLFLVGVLLCFFLVLPITLQFLLEFNVWLGVEPSLRLTDWMSFATFLPLVFGICFQTPLLMMALERVGIFRVEDFRAKRRYAIFAIVVAAAVITPTGDPFTLMVLALPMIGLYELGILLVSRSAAKRAAMADTEAGAAV
jgi:sec-independent protein translocase protein TatC